MSPFPGFPAQGLQFLTDLMDNNNRDWFQARKKVYQDYIVAPGKAFVLALGEGLAQSIPHIQFDTRTNGAGSMMRIYRDTRFSKDKTPYKDYIGFVFWEGVGKKTETPAFYLGLQGNGIGIHVGMHGFGKEMLAAYREAVVDDVLGAELIEATTAVINHGYPLNEPHYKRVPRGYDKEHPRADWLRYNGLYASSSHIPPAQVSSPQLIDICLDHFSKMAPIQQWLVKVHQRSLAEAV